MSKAVEVEITGTTALLQHRFGESAEVNGDNGSGTRKALVQKRIPRDEAEAVAYRLPSGELYMPGAAISRMLREAGGGHKMRGSRKSLKYIVPAAIMVTDEFLPLIHPETNKPLKDFEVDSRPVTIPATKGRIMRHRPRLDKWRARFKLVVHDDVLAVDTIHTLMTEGGARIGVGDYRPEKGGPFGVFQVTRWEVKA